MNGVVPSARPFGIYIHVPFCASRCGYCDFNTYVPAELGTIPAAGTDGTAMDRYVDAAVCEVEQAARTMAQTAGGPPEVATVFLGGGTPTLLPVAGLARLLDAVRAAFPVAADVEITAEANPETVTPEMLEGLRGAGLTRLSIGMQSARSTVLAVLDRHHTPGRAVAAARQATAAGFEHVSLDLIYGTPGESDDDWRASLDAALAAGTDHISCYALVVEDGTALARRVRSGAVAPVDPDVQARRYETADRVLEAAGLGWYEVSNWAAGPAGRCRHNLLYWHSADWWGVGPGAHSHVAGQRWWNVRRPETYAGRLLAGESPAEDRERLDAATRRREEVMLRVRLSDGLPLDLLPARARPLVAAWVDDGMVQPGPMSEERLVLTRRGRLLADLVVRGLWDCLDG